MGNIFSGYKSPSESHHSDMEWGGAATETGEGEEEERLIVDNRCVIRKTPYNVYIVAPEDSPFYKEVEHFSEFLHSDSIGISLSNWGKNYSLAQLSLGTAEEMIRHNIVSEEEDNKDQEDREIHIDDTDHRKVFSRKPAHKNGTRQFARVNLLATYVTEYHKWASRLEQEELKELRAAKEAIALMQAALHEQREENEQLKQRITQLTQK